MENRNKVLLYSNLAIQMGIIIGVGTYFGNYLDETYQSKTPAFFAFQQLLHSYEN